MPRGEQVDNVYVIDTKMFGFSRYCSAFLVAAKEIALIDTGPPTSAQFVRAGIESNGFALEDISYILITHMHFDHSGSAGILLKDMPKAKVMVPPRFSKHISDPSIINVNTRRDAGESIATKFGELVPIPSSRVHSLHDGEVLDLGNGEKLRVFFTPGHHNSAVAILDEKNMGLFIGDTPGLYFADEDALLMPSPHGSDMNQSIDTIKMLMNLSAKKLFLGHYGICTRPKEVMERAIDAIEVRLKVGAEAIKEAKPEELTGRMIASMAPDIEKLRARGENLRAYITEELIPFWSRGFEAYYQKLQEK